MANPVAIIEKVAHSLHPVHLAGHQARHTAEHAIEKTAETEENSPASGMHPNVGNKLDR